MYDTNIFRKRTAPLLFLGLLVSLYLSHHHIEVKSSLQVGPSICSFDEVFDCDSVAQSSHSEVFGVPVAFLGAFFYASILLLFLFTRDVEKSIRRSVNAIVFVILSFTLISSLYLAYYSYVDLGKVCIFCTLLYLVNIALFFLAFHFKDERGEFGAAVGYFVSKFLPSMNGVFFLLWNIGLVLLVIYFPKIYQKHYLIPRYLSVYDKTVIGSLLEQWKSSEFVIDQEVAKNLPGAIVRNPESKEEKVITIVEYADYECPACQKVAPVLEKVYAENRNKLRLVLLQYPLDKSCNRAIEGAFHQDSCRIARTVLCADLDYGLSALEIHERILTDNLATKEGIEKLISEYGIDESKCTKADQALKDQIEFAIKADIHSTPSIFAEGKKVVFSSFPQIERVLTAIIQRD